MRKIKLTLSLCLAASLSFAQNFTEVINVAGNGTYGTTTNGTAIAKNLAGPEGVVVDHSGNIYIADKANGVILKVNAFGVINIIAGTTGSYGYAGDGGPASAALFNSPSYLCLDPSNSLYICDAGNYVIRKITAVNGNIGSNCIVTTVAGDGSTCLTGSGSPVCGNAVLATAASFNPAGIAVDNNYNLYIATNSTIKEVFNTTTVINSTTYQAGYIYIIAGTEGVGNFSGNNGLAINALLNAPHGIALDASSANLYICDSDNSQVRKINLATRIITAFAGVGNMAGSTGDGGPATSAKLSTNQYGIAVDASNNVFIADEENFKIRMVNAAGIISTIAGTGGVPGACNYLAPAGNNNSHTGANVNPYQIAVDACGSVYFADFGSSVIGKMPNGPIPNYGSISVSSPSPVCAGSSITASGTVGSGVPPDSYSWSIISCDANGHGDDVYSSESPTINNTTQSTTSSYTFPYVSAMPCGHNYLVGMTVQKNCPTLTINTVYKQIYINCGDLPVITPSSTIICAGSTATLTSNYVYSLNNHIDWSTGSTNLGTNQTITVSPTVNTTYVLTGTYVVTGCVGTASVTIDVQNIQPNFSMSNGTGTGGATSPFYTIEVSNPTTSSDPSFKYYWAVEEVTGTTPGPYTKVANTEVDNNPCWWTGTSPHWFGGYQATNPPQYPSTNPTLNCTATFGSSPDVGQPGQGYFLKGHQYQVTYATWSNTCPWTRTGNPISTVAYTCPGCKEEQGTKNAFFTPDITFEEAMGIKNNESKLTIDNSINIYPNPSNGDFTVETSATTSQLVEVYDLTGRIVKSQTLNGKVTISGSDLPDGVYNIKITGNNTIVNKRMIIAK